MSSPPIPVSSGDGAFDPSVRWFQQAVFYEVLIRGFFDANNDGTGDLPGLRAKLDYIEWLGIDCIWMLPFYPSPFRDGGYDISDFFNVHPDYGSIGDLVAFLDDAHRRGIRVIADLVMNHTSDEHPWFIESRSSRDNAKADWYVWNDDDQSWPDARVVFTDVETLQLDLGRHPPAVLLAPLLPPPARPQLREPRSGRHHDRPRPLLARPRLRRLPARRRALPLPARRDHRGAPARDPRVHQAGSQADRRRLSGTHPARRGQRVAERRGRLLRRRRRVPPVLPLPAHAAAVHGGPPGAAVPDHRDPGPDPGHRRRQPVGHLPAQPRRAHPRDRSATRSGTTSLRSTPRIPG